MTDLEQQEYQRRKAEYIRKKKRHRTFKRIRAIVILLLIIVLIVCAISSCSASSKAKKRLAQLEIYAAAESKREAADYYEKQQNSKYYSVKATDQTAQIGNEVESQYAVIIDVDNKTILAEKQADSRIYPASMTKVLSLLVAAENISDWSGTTVMDIENQDYCFANKCSVVGYELNEVLPISELPYGTILSSGADAVLAMADVCAGDWETFVGMMNDKCEALGIGSTTHFSNAVGIYEADHYTTCVDMALIMKAAMENEFAAGVLGTRTFSTAPTTEHPEGQNLANLFLQRIDTQELNGLTVLGAKTGYVAQSGYCSVSCAENSEGHRFIVVTGMAGSAWQAVYDHTTLYNNYAK